MAIVPVRLALRAFMPSMASSRSLCMRGRSTDRFLIPVQPKPR